MSKPNIVFIYSDQHRCDAVGCAGHPVIKTPHLDRLGSEGVVFSQCYTNGPKRRILHRNRNFLVSANNCP